MSKELEEIAGDITVAYIAGVGRTVPIAEVEDVYEGIYKRIVNLKAKKEGWDQPKW